MVFHTALCFFLFSIIANFRTPRIQLLRFNGSLLTFNFFFANIIEHCLLHTRVDSHLKSLNSHQSVAFPFNSNLQN